LSAKKARLLDPYSPRHEPTESTLNPRKNRPNSTHFCSPVRTALADLVAALLCRYCWWSPESASTAAWSSSSVATVAGRPRFIEPFSPPHSIAQTLSLFHCCGVTGSTEGRTRWPVTGRQRSSTLHSLSVHASLSLVLVVDGLGKREPLPVAVKMKEKGGCGPPPFFASLSLAQSTKIACLISNLIPHNLSRIDNTTLRRLFDLKKTSRFDSINHKLILRLKT